MATDAQKALDNINKIISRNRTSERALEDAQRQEALKDPKVLKEREKTARRITRRSQDREKIFSLRQQQRNLQLEAKK